MKKIKENIKQRKTIREVHSVGIILVMIPCDCPWCLETARIEVDDFEKIKDEYIVKCKHCYQKYKVICKGLKKTKELKDKERRNKNGTSKYT